jgi:hypothetical protein
VKDGCHPNRETSAELESAGFESADNEKIIAPALVVNPQMSVQRQKLPHETTRIVQTYLLQAVPELPGKDVEANFG